MEQPQKKTKTITISVSDPIHDQIAALAKAGYRTIRAQAEKLLLTQLKKEGETDGN